MEGIFSGKNDTKTKLRPFALSLMLVTVIMAAAYPGTGLKTGFAIVTIALTVFSVVVFSRSLFSILLTAIPVTLVWFYTGGSFAYAALLCSPIAVIGIGTFLLRTTRSPLLIGIIPASYLVALLAGGRPVAAMWSLVFFPAAYVTALGFSGKTPRIKLLCRTSVTLGLTGAVAAVAYLTVKHGYFSFELVKTATDGLLTQLTEFFARQYTELAKLYTEYGLDTSALTLSPADAKLYALSIFTIIPALAICVLSGVSFIAYQTTLSLFDYSGQRRYFNHTTVSFTMSRVSAVVFIITYLVMFFCSFSGESDLLLIAENLYLVLLPGLTLTGILVAFGKGADGRKHIFRIILMAVLMFIMPSLALAFAAFTGCGAVLAGPMRRRHEDN